MSNTVESGQNAGKDAPPHNTSAPQPTFFGARVQLPVQGRADTLAAASERMWVVIKAYAAGGENGMHTHINEDHVFFVLGGAANFAGPNGERQMVRENEGVMLPAGCYYSFEAAGDAPLIMLRIGASEAKGEERYLRLNINGDPVEPSSQENKTVPLIMSTKFFE